VPQLHSIVAAVLLLTIASPASAFHRAGVAACNTCHTMHNSEDGTLVDADSPSGNQYLLRDETPSDVCLSCHGGFISDTFGSDPLNPPPEVGSGNFVFLLEDNLNDGAGVAINGDAAGHNINAPSRGVGADGTLVTGPGGSFPSSALGCTSCHDPHGNQNFRLLYGAGPVQDGLHTFTHPAFEADGLSVYHGQERNDRHTAYKSGVSRWCGNCHGDFHHNMTQYVHPSGHVLTGPISTNYDLYNGTDDTSGGSHATAYLAAVPFEDPANTRNSTAGPAPSSRVMCLSCHRAHASSAPDAGRRHFNVTFLADDGGASGSYPIPNPYGSASQRSLCNKCHVRDAGGA
jgi:hypothetical protein